MFHVLGSSEDDNTKFHIVGYTFALSSPSGVNTSKLDSRYQNTKIVSEGHGSFADNVADRVLIADVIISNGNGYPATAGDTFQNVTWRILLTCPMRILSGIQPCGALHLGNYFGMMRPAIELQEKGEAFYFIADYHSMTSLFDADERRKNTLDVALDFLACGLDPKKSVFFRQSDVPEVTELSWLLSTVTPMGLLESAIRTKTKSPKAFRPITACSPIRC